MNSFGIGQPVRRVEDRRFLTGRSRYVDDVELPRQVHGALVLSPHAHARIRHVDISRAAAAPGVICVLTGADVARERLGGIPPLAMPEDMGGPKGFRTFRPVLVADKVRHVGERVAFVVAATAAQAREAAELVEVDYEPLPAVARVEDAVEKGAGKIWDDWTSNVCFTLAMGNKEATDAAFARARYVVSLRLLNNRLSANALEPRGAIGDYNPADDSYTLYTSTQNPHGARTVLAQAVFHLPETKFRVIAQDVGGGFGMKGDTYPEEGLVLWASRRCGRPVKWIQTRSEGLLNDDHGRDQVVQGELALDEAGKILALRAQALHAVGAYIVGAAVVPVLYSLKLIPSAYVVPSLHVMSRAVFTNTSPTGPYRGAGRPEAVYLTERLLDRAAAVVGIDPVEIRRRNFIPATAMPYQTPTGFVYDSGEFAATTDRCLEIADWKGFAARRAASEKRGKRRGRALTYYIEDCGVFNDRMELRFDPSGNVPIVAGTLSHGPGHATTYAPTVPARLGIGLEASGAWSAEPQNFPNGAHVCEVEVDPETGEVAIDRYIVVDDVGRVINPLICEGQIQGGLAQGIGQALFEHVAYDRESGQLLSGTFAEYCMPRADDLPRFDLDFHEVPCRTNPLGVKGVGEAGSVGAPPTVINAILDALRPLGVDHLDMPATPAQIWERLVARAK